MLNGVDKSFLDGGYVKVRWKTKRFSELLLNECSRFFGVQGLLISR